MKIRSRAAPAPSGELHVGNVRTFLYNWLFTRHEGGTFVLRIEDTDAERFTEEAYLAALRDLRWIGLDWDEGPEVGGEHGPYRQSQRFPLHREAAEKLLSSGAGYRCYCTKEEEDERRKAAAAEKRRYQYDERCYRLAAEVREQYEAEGRPSVVRFHVPEEGTLTFTDLIRGEVTVAHEDIEDFVVLRSDATPLYHLGVVVDDALMQITHVVRGDDHVSNTPKQVLLHAALGNPVPIFAHVPTVFGPDGKKLAKRHGSTSVAEFREQGFLPEALFNYLALLGWGTAEETLMSKEELVERFALDHVHSSPAIFDVKKLTWMNGEYIRALTEDEFARRIEPWLVREGLVADPPTAEEAERISLVAPLIQSRIKRLDETVSYARPLFNESIEIDAAAADKVLTSEHVPGLLLEGAAALSELPEWSVGEIEAALRRVVEERALKPRTAFIPFYVAISGSAVGAPLFDAMQIIGREKTLERLAKARELSAL